jgi:hypothetical protein
MVDARIPYVLVVIISKKINCILTLCANSKVALIKCIWLIFKLDFDLDDDVYSIGFKLN